MWIWAYDIEYTLGMRVREAQELGTFGSAVERATFRKRNAT